MTQWLIAPPRKADQIDRDGVPLTTVGPTVGSELIRSSIILIVIGELFILGYLWVRFGFRYGTAAIVEQYIEKRFGAKSVWILNPGAAGFSLPSARTNPNVRSRTAAANGSRLKSRES
mgnify:CR=1 FL=1